MSLTYTNTIIALEKIDTLDLPGVILCVHWIRTGTNENSEFAEYHAQSRFDTNSLNPDNFIAYADLTEAKILEWIHNDLENPSIESIILQRIEMKKITTVVPNNFPWVTVIPVPSTPIVSGDMTGIGTQGIQGV